MQETLTGSVIRASSPKGFNLVFILLLLFWVIGMTYGVLLVSGDGVLPETLQSLSGDYFVIQQGQSVLKSFLTAFQSAFLFLLIPYLLGYSSIGQPAAMVVPLFNGLGLGAFLGNLYRFQGLQGIGYSLLIIVPYTLMELLAIFIGCRESIRLSNLFFSCFWYGIPPKKGTEDHAVRIYSPVTGSVIRLYNIKFLILCVIIVIAAVIYAVCVLLFARFFHF